VEEAGVLAVCRHFARGLCEESSPPPRARVKEFKRGECCTGGRVGTAGLLLTSVRET